MLVFYHVRFTLFQEQSIIIDSERLKNKPLEVSKILQIAVSSINRDVTYLRRQAKDNIKKYIDERLPEEYEKCLVVLTAILREPLTTSQQTEDRRAKLQALSLANECYSMILEPVTNATVVDNAIRFISEKQERLKSIASSNKEDESKEQSKLSSGGSKDENRESNKADYDVRSDKEVKEKDTGEMKIATTTTNRAFVITS